MKNDILRAAALAGAVGLLSPHFSAAAEKVELIDDKKILSLREIAKSEKWGVREWTFSNGTTCLVMNGLYLGGQGSARNTPNGEFEWGPCFDASGKPLNDKPELK